MADTEIDGGTNMTVWKMTDPLNTNGNFAITRSIVNIADYTARLTPRSWAVTRSRLARASSTRSSSATRSRSLDQREPVDQLH